MISLPNIQVVPEIDTRIKHAAQRRKRSVLIECAFRCVDGLLTLTRTISEACNRQASRFGCSQIGRKLGSGFGQGVAQSVAVTGSPRGVDPQIGNLGADGGLDKRLNLVPGNRASVGSGRRRSGGGTLGGWWGK